MTLSPLISVIIPLYNKKDTVQRSIDSIKHQNLKTEIIIVDDGSTDGSLDIVKLNSNIIIIEQSNAGPSAARNNGAKHSTGKYLLFLDADDELGNGVLESHLECRRINKDVQISISSFDIIKPNNDTTSFKMCERFKPDKCDNYIGFSKQFEPELAINVASGTFCINKTLFDNHNGFDENLHCWEITEFLMRLGIKPITRSFFDNAKVIIHVQKELSQFEATSKDIVYMKYFALKLLKYLEHTEGSPADAISKQLVNLLYGMISFSNTSTVKELVLLYNQVPIVKNNISTISFISKLPNFASKIIFFYMQKYYRHNNNKNK